MKIRETVYGLGGHDPQHPTGNVLEELEHEVEDNYELHIRESLTGSLAFNQALLAKGGELRKDEQDEAIRSLVKQVSHLTRLVLGLVSEHE